MKNVTQKNLAAPAEPSVTGSFADVERFLKQPKSSRFPKDPLSRHISQVLSIHPSLQLQFRDIDLEQMDEPTKTALLEDIQVVLGIFQP